MANDNYTCMKYDKVLMKTKILIYVHDEKQSKALISILSRNQKFIKGSGQIEWLTTRISSIKKKLNSACKMSFHLITNCLITVLHVTQFFQYEGVDV